LMITTLRKNFLIYEGSGEMLPEVGCGG